MQTRDSESPERSKRECFSNHQKEFPRREDLIKCWARTLGKLQPLILGPGDCVHLEPDWEGGVEFDKQGMAWNPRRRSKGPVTQAGVDVVPSLTKHTYF